MTSTDLAVQAREWLRDYHAPIDLEPKPRAEVQDDATELPSHNN